VGWTDVWVAGWIFGSSPIGWGLTATDLYGWGLTVAKLGDRPEMGMGNGGRVDALTWGASF